MGGNGAEYLKENVNAISHPTIRYAKLHYVMGGLPGSVINPATTKELNQNLKELPKYFA